jgi:hypothetical protein
MKWGSRKAAVVSQLPPGQQQTCNSGPVECASKMWRSAKDPGKKNLICALPKDHNHASARRQHAAFCTCAGAALQQHQ